MTSADHHHHQNISSSGFGDSTIAKTRNTQKALLIARAEAASARAIDAEVAREVAEEKRVERENIREKREIERERERGAERAAAAAVAQAAYISTAPEPATKVNASTTKTTIASDASAAAAVREAAVIEWTKTSSEYARFVHARSFLRETRAHYTASVARVNETKKIVDSCLHTIASGGGTGSSDKNGESASERLAAAKILYRMQHADAAALLKEAENQKTQCDAWEKIASAAFELGWSGAATTIVSTGEGTT